MAKAKSFVLTDALLEAYATNNRITTYLIENLSEEAWHTEPPGGKGRTIGAIAAHIHNVRGMWLKAAGGDVVEKIEPRTATRSEALEALSKSYEALSRARTYLTHQPGVAYDGASPGGDDANAAC